MFKPIAREIKDQIISRIKNNGETIPKLALEYSVSPKTIYTWLRNKAENNVSFLEHARLKRENKLLLEIVGKLTLEKNQISSLKKS